DVAVPVVIDSVGVAVGCVAPDVRCEIRVGVVDPGVDHPHHHAVASGGQVPRSCRVDVRAGSPAALPRIQETPEGREGRIVRAYESADDVVRLGVFDVRVAMVGFDRLAHGRTRRQAHELEVADQNLLTTVPRACACPAARSLGVTPSLNLTRTSSPVWRPGSWVTTPIEAALPASWTIRPETSGNASARSP